MNLLFAPTLHEALDRAGLAYPEHEPEPGRLVRYGKGLASWMKVFPDQDGAVFGNWSDGTAFTWQRERSGPPPAPADLARIRQRAEEARRAAEAESEAAYQEAARKALATYMASGSVESNPYTSAKGIPPLIARERNGWLVIPVMDGAGNIQSVQSIGPTGEKRFMPGGKMAGGRCWLGDPTDSGPLVLCEGFATGASIREATGWPVCVTFTAGNLRPVACDVRKQFPRAKLVICGDDDRHTEGNPGRTKAQEAAKLVNATVVFPTFAGDQGTDFNDMAQQAGLPEVAQQIMGTVQPSRFRLLTADQLAALPPLDYRIKRILPAYGVAAFYGASGSGKTFLVLDAAMHAADGLAWFGYRSKACSVVYVGLEGAAGLPQRVKAYRTARGPHTGRNVRFITAPLSILESGDLSGLANCIKSARAGEGIVIIDTLNAAAPGADENSSADMGRIIAGAKQLQADIGGLVVLVHHTGKDAAKGLRGHSSLFAALDAAVEVTRDGDRREWSIAKSKDGEDGIAHPFRLAVVELGIDQDGDPLTSCVIEPAERTEDAMRKANLPKGGNQQIVLCALRDLLRDAKQYGMAGAPPTRPCIELEEAISRTRDRLTVEADRKTERTRSAITGLVNRGAIVLREGWLWLA
jgi:phage/plasmid primase-like uncharacterized protein